MPTARLHPTGPRASKQRSEQDQDLFAWGRLSEGPVPGSIIGDGAGQEVLQPERHEERDDPEGQGNGQPARWLRSPGMAQRQPQQAPTGKQGHDHDEG